MLIGIDGNEANVKDRVGSGVYAFELLHQFANISPASYSSSEAKRSREVLSEVSSRQVRTVKYDFVIYLKSPPLPDLPKESANFKYKVFGPKKLWTQFALPLRLAFGQKLDVFFSMGHYGPRFSKIPFVITIHDLSYLHFPQMFKKNDLYQLVNWTRYSVKAAVHIIAVSETTKKDIIENYSLDPSKITVTHEGFDQSRFKPLPKSKIESSKKKYNIRGDYLIFIGTLQPRKNIERLIEAFAKLIANLTPGVSKGGTMHTPGVLPDDLKLVIIGKKGWLYDSVFEKVKELNLENKVVFTDFVPDEDLPALISFAKVYVLPSLWEGFGIPVIEAQACGVPVVVSNTSSLPEIVTSPTVIPAEAGIKNKDQILDQVFDRESQVFDSETQTRGTESVENDNRASAILVDPESVESIAAGIKKALDPNTKSDLVKKGFANIKRFSWQKCARETLTILEKVASKRSP